jgi:hypothetical protein
MIRSSFPCKKMFTTPRLVQKQREYFDTSGVLPECEFKEAFVNLKKWILETAQVKNIGGVVCNGTTLAHFLEVLYFFLSSPPPTLSIYLRICKQTYILM